jgi:spermidine/putrescine transport system ATP-binding protein
LPRPRCASLPAAAAPLLDPVIQLEAISKRYGPSLAVDGIDLCIGRGEFFALLGPSGCGKSTTLRLIAGLEAPSGGVIRLEGVDVTATPPHRRQVNTVFQHYALFPHLSVWDNVAFGPRSRRLAPTEIRRRVGEALEMVRLSDLARRHPRQLSGGQQQRVALARALVNAPAALLLDEPMAALDPNLRRAMQTELKRIQREVGLSFLIVTHDQEEALALSDRLAVMNAGRIEQVGSPHALYDTPVSPFVAAFIGRANLLPLADGQRRLLLRPEQLQLRQQGPGQGEQGMRATVDAVIFQGPLLQIQLTGSEGTALVAHVPRHSPAAHLGSGSTTWVVWDPATAHQLP